MGTSIFTYLKELKNKPKKENLGKKEKKNFKEYINKINRGADNILMLAEPKIFTMAKENNIAFKLDENILVTKDGNLCVGIEIKGISYSGISLEEEISYLQSRTQFFGKISSDIEINLIVKKDRIELVKQNSNSKNVFANQIIEKWENHKDAFQITYYLIISTVEKKISGALESFKNKTTKEKEQSKEEKESFSLEVKKNIINETLTEAKRALSIFNPTQITADDILNFYATYSNAQETKFRYTNELITDSYISSNVEFKKDYILFERNDGKQMFSRFISIKAYETDIISSHITTKILRSSSDFIIFMNMQAYEKEKAIKKVKDTGAFAPQIIKDELSGLIEIIRADRENLMLVSFSVYILAENLEDLETKTNELKGILANQNLNIVRETINQKALYFSFFPSRANLNARKRTLKVSNLASIANFEKDVLGFAKNDWGEQPVTIFRHLSGTPYLFNFHWTDQGDKPSGHTMIIGGTGAGKTTLAQFLMCNLYKYDIDIFSMDKLRGMYNFATYTDGEYHDADFSDFKLNPFALPYTSENKSFLQNFIQKMANIEDTQYNAVNEISKTIERLYNNKLEEDIFTLSDFIDSLQHEENDIKGRLRPFQNSIFDNKQDALSFNKQLSILNMDSILKNPTLASLTASYIFHRLKNSAKNSKKRGFFCFIDELKDFLMDENMRESILESILEVRKIGGVMCMGFQNLSFFDDIPKGASFLENIANYIIFPTTNAQTLENMRNKLNLTPTELKFLQEAGTNSRQVLLKMNLSNQSAILNIDLSRLGKHLRVFSSSSDNVMLMKELKELYPNDWRNMYLENQKPNLNQGAK
ncbi:AAA family ATPase [Campylobacter jejuni]|uniref:VirB4 family type IV secretion/conjugal transfer ATPase n=1 Tax=Campylobacter jejuni TaxID=197 RepID=UPI000E11AA70|nr:AAA family ATPase [Campylobacter jejuni]EAI9884035.1 AAA family ATPase [Campylobacter coli]EAH6175639.1 AAA family ATPase [Campylobacter jejuni]EAH8076081.1 AAA family ATPase [Campylobacter jejuni]EAH9620295.1 AAA family ATPase [Campylobacter jejuni]EAI0552994.1 AAA family ATPase [Campylobacter jejuni]